MLRRPRGRWLFAVGTAVGIVGFLLALATGPHAGGFFMLWLLLAQAVQFVRARVAVRRWVRDVAAPSCDGMP